ncbi:MAG: peptide chain release factor N(5)-glutamine methyltransferase [Pseudomonadota bacterium]
MVRGLTIISYNEALKTANNRLAEAGIADAHIDARILILGACRFTNANLVSRGREPMPTGKRQLYDGYINRRLEGEPVQRILGQCEFYSREFLISGETLVPRQDTETLIDAAINQYEKDSGMLRILEFGTGSGIIAISLAAELESVQITATDISLDAISTARQNAQRHGVAKEISFVCKDGLNGIVGPFNWIVSNPPYIPSSEIPNLSIEVGKHDPHGALDGGEDGLDFYRQILKFAGNNLAQDGIIFLEIGFDQEDAVTDIAKNCGFIVDSAVKDLPGIVRTLVIKRK